MIKSISFKNYKAFKAKQTIELKPLTILLGPNSAGKSSILNLFRLLYQSYKYGDSPFFLQYNGPFVNMGNYSNIANKRIKNEHVIIDVIFEEEDSYIQFDVSEKFSELNIISKVNTQLLCNYLDNPVTAILDPFKSNGSLFTKSLDGILGKEKTKDVKSIIKLIFPEKTDSEVDKTFSNIFNNIKIFSLAINNKGLFGLDNIDGFDLEEYKNSILDESEKKYLPKEVIDLEFYPPENYIGAELQLDDGTAIQTEDFSIEDRIDKYLHKVANYLKNNNTNKSYNKFLGKFLIKFIRWYSFKTINDHYIPKAKGLLPIRRNKKVFVDLFNIAPIRPLPRNTYTKEEIEECVLQRKNMYLGDGKTFEEQYFEGLKICIDQINNGLKTVGIHQRLEVIKLHSDSTLPPLFSIKVLDKKSGTIVNYTEVGFGLSQVIPVLSIFDHVISNNSGNDLSVIEQPELHLHPATQANLAKFIVEKYKLGPLFASENPDRNHSKAIFETHSEHFVRGLQVEVAKGNLPKEDIVFYYVDRYKNGNSYVKKLELDDNGRFVNGWPKGFFETGFRQAMDLLRSQKN